MCIYLSLSLYIYIYIHTCNVCMHVLWPSAPRPRKAAWNTRGRPPKSVALVAGTSDAALHETSPSQREAGEAAAASA